VIRLFHYAWLFARILAWIGILAIVVLSVAPAEARLITKLGPLFEHFTAFALVGGAFAIGYDLSFGRLMLLAFFFCGVIELLQVPLPTRHSRISDFIIDFVSACIAFALVCMGRKIVAKKAN
jgi:VanZ family protein